jgi:NADH-quinone oxidoreductase subunit L
VLAYSTVSQLGFMFIGVGVAAYTAGIFHLVTHAFFKACLFLGSGSVIHAMGGEQDIRNMGGLWKKIPITAWTFLIATITIAGFPPFAGFFSKDEILVSALTTPYLPLSFNRLIWAMATVAALFTAYYMFRLFFLTFMGDFRGTHEQEHHIHESPPTMTFPLIVLAALSILGGVLGIPGAIGEPLHIRHFLGEWLAPIYPRGTTFEAPERVEWFLMFTSTAVAVFGAWLAYNRFYKRGVAADVALEKELPALTRTLENKYYVDEFYGHVVVRPLERASQFLWRGIDALIDGLLALLGYTIALFGDLLRFFQTGNVRNYALMFFVGVIVFIWVMA